MGDGRWRANGLSPFLSERARIRAPEILSFAAVTGAAMLVSPRGEVVLASGSTSDADGDRIARIARAQGGGERITSFTFGTICVHTAPVCMGWMLCVLSTSGVSSSTASPALAQSWRSRSSTALVMDHPAAATAVKARQRKCSPHVLRRARVEAPT